LGTETFVHFDNPTENSPNPFFQDFLPENNAVNTELSVSEGELFPNSNFGEDLGCSNTDVFQNILRGSQEPIKWTILTEEEKYLALLEKQLENLKLNKNKIKKNTKPRAKPQNHFNQGQISVDFEHFKHVILDVQADNQYLLAPQEEVKDIDLSLQFPASQSISSDEPSEDDEEDEEDTTTEMGFMELNEEGYEPL